MTEDSSRRYASPIPPIEIGTFDAFHPQNSEFTGSSSGVFFVNTVFRAFAKIDTTAGAGVLPNATSLDRPPVSEFVDATDASHGDSAVQPHTNGEDGSTREHEINGPAAKRNTYGNIAKTIGDAPRPALAKELIMLYFQHWHPYFPFLHGPTFFAGVRTFYNNGPDDTTREKGDHNKLCRAITYQCIFNIAASAHLHGLPASSRIQSPYALVESLGALFMHHDITTLQALVAAELYLVSIMSLRAASTVHGILTRKIYHAGLHRCPFRYIQLPLDVCQMRKRILWSAYILDRYLSQSLGYPLGLQDLDIDVCVPCNDELHKPANSSQGRSTPEDVQCHLPKTHTSSENDELESLAGSSSQPHRHGIVIRTNPSPIANHQLTQTPQEATVLIQGYFVTYSQLLTEALELFHKSLHARSITNEKVTELSYKINSWWNGLPATFETPESNPSYAAFFTISYHHLIILINRPFLSLRTDTINFRSSLQKAVSASRSVVSQLSHVVEDPFLRTWPSMLSAAWMAGLVLAYATLLDMYSLSKANFEITKCLEALQYMGRRWVGAKHCHQAMRTLLTRLNKQSDMPGVSNRVATSDCLPCTQRDDPTSTASPPEEVRGTKRRRVQDAIHPDTAEQQALSNPADNLYGDMTSWPDWTPIMQYNGPDFGFDAMQTDFQQTETQFISGFDFSNTDLFDDMGWSAFTNEAEGF